MLHAVQFLLRCCRWPPTSERPSRMVRTMSRTSSRTWHSSSAPSSRNTQYSSNQRWALHHSLPCLYTTLSCVSYCTLPCLYTTLSRVSTPLSPVFHTALSSLCLTVDAGSSMYILVMLFSECEFSLFLSTIQPELQNTLLEVKRLYIT